MQMLPKQTPPLKIPGGGGLFEANSVSTNFENMSLAELQTQKTAYGVQIQQLTEKENAAKAKMKQIQSSIDSLAAERQKGKFENSGLEYMSKLASLRSEMSGVTLELASIQSEKFNALSALNNIKIQIEIQNLNNNTSNNFKALS